MTHQTNKKWNRHYVQRLVSERTVPPAFVAVLFWVSAPMGYVVVFSDSRRVPHICLGRGRHRHNQTSINSSEQKKKWGCYVVAVVR